MNIKSKISLITSAGALTYVLLCGILKTNQIKILYRPQKLTNGYEDFISVFKTNDDKDEIFGWIENPGQDKALIYCGGSSEAVELRRHDLSRNFKEHTIYVVPYRGFGPNKKLKPSESVLKKDIEALYDFVKTKHTKIDVIGRSLGTSIAVHLCVQRNINKIALITPFSSILSVAENIYRWVPVKILLNDKHEVWRDVSNIKIPIIACLASNDKVTPLKLWHDLKKYITTDVDVYEDKISDHTTIANSSDMWEAISAFFKGNKI